MLADAGLADRCDDINECLIDTDLCHSNGVCTNTDGSFQCGCGIGFQGQNFEIRLWISEYHYVSWLFYISAKAADLSEYESALDGRVTTTGRNLTVLGVTNEEARLRESTRQIIFDNIVCQDTDECFDSSSQSCK